MGKVTLEEMSAGGVVYRRIRGSQKPKVESYEFLIGKHSGYHKWVLPKGLVERGEGPVQAAVREVEEEVGVRAKVRDLSPLKVVEYWYYADLEEVMGHSATGKKTTRRVKKYQEAPDFAEASTGDSGKKTRVHKRVIFYLMVLELDLGKSGWEMEERRWVSYEEASKLLSFESEREVLLEATLVLSASGQN